MSLELLKGVRVLEVSMLAADILGQHLADLGAEVIKLERPERPDYCRWVGPAALGGPKGLAVFHLIWNRGKKSVFLDLEDEQGRATFLEMVKSANVVIEGLRGGTLDRWGVGFEVLKHHNERIILCTLSGMGSNGPYSTLPTHGTFFDAYTGRAPAQYVDGDPEPRVPTTGGSMEYMAGGVYGALAVVAALTSVARTGKGEKIDISQTDALTAFQAEKVGNVLNREKIVRRGSYGEGINFEKSVRSNYYKTSDNRVVYLQAVEDKFWRAFCLGIGRGDLYEKYPSMQDYDHAMGREDLRAELRSEFRARTQAEWTTFLIDHQIPGGPVYTLDELVHDEHFIARGNIGTVTYSQLGDIRLLTSPIRVEGQEFELKPAPEPGQDTADASALT